MRYVHNQLRLASKSNSGKKINEASVHSVGYNLIVTTTKMFAHSQNST